jgi:hypothetical protein
LTDIGDAISDDLTQEPRIEERHVDDTNQNTSDPEEPPRSYLPCNRIVQGCDQRWPDNVVRARHRQSGVVVVPLMTGIRDRSRQEPTYSAMVPAHFRIGADGVHWFARRHRSVPGSESDPRRSARRAQALRVQRDVDGIISIGLMRQDRDVGITIGPGRAPRGRYQSRIATRTGGRARGAGTRSASVSGQAPTELGKRSKIESIRCRGVAQPGSAPALGEAAPVPTALSALVDFQCLQ